MTLDDRQSERIARWLDGHPVDLTEAERAVAEEIQRDQTLLESEVPAPRAAMERARQQMRAELARTARHGLQTRWFARVAAALLIACTTWLLFTALPTKKPAHAPPTEIAEVPLEELLDAMEHSTVFADLDQLEQEIAEIRAEIAVSTQNEATDLKIEAIEQQLNNLWIEDLDDGFLIDAG
jgi:hypothetical protein